MKYCWCDYIVCTIGHCTHTGPSARRRRRRCTSNSTIAPPITTQKSKQNRDHFICSCANDEWKRERKYNSPGDWSTVAERVRLLVTVIFIWHKLPFGTFFSSFFFVSIYCPHLKLKRIHLPFVSAQLTTQECHLHSSALSLSNRMLRMRDFLNELSNKNKIRLLVAERSDSIVSCFFFFFLSLCACLPSRTTEPRNAHPWNYLWRKSFLHRVGASVVGRQMTVENIGVRFARVSSLAANISQQNKKFFFWSTCRHVY